MEVRGFPDYLIYPDGRVSSKRFPDRFLTHILTGENRKYHSVILYNEGIKTQFRVHRLIAEHYIPNPENKSEVDHINRNPSDNRVENLRWATRIENVENRGIFKNNKSGHKYIIWDKSNKRWKFRMRGKYKANRCFKTKIECIHYKFYYLLKINLLKKIKKI